ncbi:HupE/UreJ family protein [Jannaschia sp. Os4]|nr:HupE/UreJ family protein [Jannaschia sp. Os4]
MALALLVSIAAGRAHEVQPSVADVTVTGDALVMELRTAIEPLVAGIDLSAVEDTDESPLAGLSDRLRAMEPEALAAELARAWPAIAARMDLRAGDAALDPVLEEVVIPPVGDVDTRRDSRLTIRAALPDDGSPVTVGWDGGLGGLIVRQGEGEDAYSAFLSAGGTTDPLPRGGAAEAGLGEAVARYLVSGFDHIVPKGLDHILFVLGLLFYAFAWRPLLWQVTAFTAAHTVTLALATVGVVDIPDGSMWIVESVIALSIVYVAVENLLVAHRTRELPAAANGNGPIPDAALETPEIGWARIGIVFAFGLLHGLGFASVLSEFGLGQHLVASLIAFNVGVELGQLAVIAAAAILVWVAFRVLHRRFHPEAEAFRAVSVVGSILIALVGAWWVIERTLLG